MLGLVVTQYNRGFYTERCIESLLSADLKDVFIVLVDDASTDPKAKELLRHPLFNATLVNKRNLGVNLSLKSGWDLCAKSCDVLMNLDNDALVSPDFVGRVLALLDVFPNRVVSGFNCQSVNERGQDRHPVVNETEYYIEKRKIGGINTCFTRQTYKKYILPNLRPRLYNWDNRSTMNMSAKGLHPVVTKPSCIQHIGEISSLGHNFNIDYAADFA